LEGQQGQAFPGIGEVLVSPVGLATYALHHAKVSLLRRAWMSFEMQRRGRWNAVVVVVVVQKLKIQGAYGGGWWKSKRFETHCEGEKGFI
jgi:hypothetical protein